MLYEVITSKSLKNVINPDDVIRDYGADSCRMYEMFMGPLEVSKPWSTQGLIGVSRFLERVWALSERPMTDGPATDRSTPAAEGLTRLLHKTIKKVTDDTASLNFNTAISQMMIFTNELSKAEAFPKALWAEFVKLLAPYAPHLGEELWERLGNGGTVAYESWPKYESELTVDNTVTIVVQVNGKIRDKFEAALGTDKAELEKTALGLSGAVKFLDGKAPKKVIVVPNKLV